VNIFKILPKPSVRVIESLESASLYRSPTIEDFSFLYGNQANFGQTSDSQPFGKNPLDIFLYKNICFRGESDEINLLGDYFMVMEHQYYSHYIKDIIAPFLYIRHFVPSLKLLVVSKYYKEFNKKQYDFDEGVGKMMKDLDAISHKHNIEIEFVSQYHKIKIENLYYWDQDLFTKHSARHSYEMQDSMHDIIFKLVNKELALKNEKTEKIYISRKHSNADPRNSISPRYIEKEEVIEEYFISLGYSVHYLESYNLEEQIELFSKASKVVGFTGSGLTNVLWTDKDTPIDVIEICSWMDYTDNAWRRMAEALGHNFFFIGMSNTSNSQKIVENLKKFNNILM
jgi:hypothetical protein